MSQVDWARLRDQCIVGLAAIAFLWAASQVIGRLVHIVVVVLLALVLAFALEPLLRFAQRVLPRALAAVLIYALALGLIAAFILLAGPPAVYEGEALATRLPSYLDQLNHFAPFAGTDFGGSVRTFAESALSSALTVIAAIAGGVIDAVLVLVLGFWFMVDGSRMADIA